VPHPVALVPEGEDGGLRDPSNLPVLHVADASADPVEGSVSQPVPPVAPNVPPLALAPGPVAGPAAGEAPASPPLHPPAGGALDPVWVILEELGSLLPTLSDADLQWV
jgi:hypothetical protein